MDIINKIILNKKGETGIIEEINENKIKVRYKNNGMIKNSTYQYPYAFKQGFLRFRDEKLNNYINDIIKEYKCSYCGNKDFPIEEIDEKKICSNCKRIRLGKCFLCQEEHLKEKLLFVNDKENLYWTKRQICHICAEENTFICEKCGKRLYNDRQYKNLKSKKLCKECAESTVEECYFCRKLYDKDDGETLYYGNEEFVNVCPECVMEHTFECSRCHWTELNNRQAISKYISYDKKICIDCACKCEVCKKYIEKEDAILAYGKNYCSDCWKTYKKNCIICCDDYISEKGEKICPDCIEMEQYMDRLNKIDFKSQKFIKTSLYNLQNIDRCELFTNLYDSCLDLVKLYCKSRSKNPCHLLIMSIMNYDVVITYLPDDIVGNVRYSESITLTEFRHKKVYSSVEKKIKYWMEKIQKSVITAAGEMKILGYPIQLRIQTKYDKVYGKRWDGYGYYTEIGNYGDTTNFYIIGIIDK